MRLEGKLGLCIFSIRLTVLYIGVRQECSLSLVRVDTAAAAESDRDAGEQEVEDANHDEGAGWSPKVVEEAREECHQQHTHLTEEVVEASHSATNVAWHDFSKECFDADALNAGRGKHAKSHYEGPRGVRGLEARESEDEDDRPEEEGHSDAPS